MVSRSTPVHCSRRCYSMLPLSCYGMLSNLATSPHRRYHDSAVWDLTNLGSPAMPIIERLQETGQMCHRGANDKYMENLM